MAAEVNSVSSEGSPDRAAAFAREVIRRQRSAPFHHFAYLMGHQVPAEETSPVRTTFERTLCNGTEDGGLGLGAVFTLLDISMGISVRGSGLGAQPMVTSSLSLFRVPGGAAGTSGQVGAECVGLADGLALARGELTVEGGGSYAALANFIAPRSLAARPVDRTGAQTVDAAKEQRVVEMVGRMDPERSMYDQLFSVVESGAAEFTWEVPLPLTNRHGNTHGGAIFGYAGRVAEERLAREGAGWRFATATVVYAASAPPQRMVATVEDRRVSASTAMLGIDVRTGPGRAICHIDLVYRRNASGH